jgi:hypothetical protein
MHKILSAFSVLILTSITAVADQDIIAQRVAGSDNVYSALEPLGQIRVRFGAAAQGRQTLELECDLFKATIPPEGLADLSRPDWSALSMTYSVRTTGRETQGPYISLKVPLNGPPGEKWEQTRAEFHFDSQGRISRQIVRLVPDPVLPRTTHHISREWKIGSGITAESALSQPRK